MTTFQFWFALFFSIFAGWCMWFGNGKKKEMQLISVFFGLAVFIFLIYLSSK